MLTGLAALENTNWSRVRHAHGRATDTPGHLRALLTQDSTARKHAVSHLWSAIIHQGTPYTATEPTALVVAGFLNEQLIGRDDPIREELLSFLVNVAEACDDADMTLEEIQQFAEFDIDPYLDSEDEDALHESFEAGNSFFARSILGCIRVAPVLLQVLLHEMESAGPNVWSEATRGLVKLVKIEALTSYAPTILSRLLVAAGTAQDTDELSAIVLALGELGYSPREFMQHASPAVRLCAALAPSLANDPAAINELVSAVRQHAGEIDTWFVNKPPQFPMQPRFAVVARLVQQVKDFDQLVDAAVAIVAITSKYCVDADWGHLLVAAFPDGSGTVTTESQRKFLTALVNKSELWDRTWGNAYGWFRQAGLPYDRQACARIAG